MSRVTPDTRPSREIFAAKLRTVRTAEYNAQMQLHTLRQALGRPLQRTDVPEGMLQAMEKSVEEARVAGKVMLGDQDRVDELLRRAFKLEKARADKETGIDTIR